MAESSPKSPTFHQLEIVDKVYDKQYFSNVATSFSNVMELKNCIAFQHDKKPQEIKIRFEDKILKDHDPVETADLPNYKISFQYNIADFFGSGESDSTNAPTLVAQFIARQLAIDMIEHQTIYKHSAIEELMSAMIGETLGPFTDYNLHTCVNGVSVPVMVEDKEMLPEILIPVCSAVLDKIKAYARVGTSWQTCGKCHRSGMISCYAFRPLSIRNQDSCICKEEFFICTKCIPQSSFDLFSRKENNPCMLTKFQCQCSKERSICELMIPGLGEMYLRAYNFDIPVVYDENERIEWVSPMEFKDTSLYSEFDYPLPAPKEQEQPDYFATLYDFCSPQNKEARGKPTHHEDNSIEVALIASNPRASIGDVLATVLGTNVFGSTASQFWRLEQTTDVEEKEERSPKRHKSCHQSQQPISIRNHREQNGFSHRRRNTPIQTQAQIQERINFEIIEKYIYSTSGQGPNNNIPCTIESGNNTNVTFCDDGNFGENVMAL